MNMKKLVAAAALALMVVGTQAGAETLRVGSETVYPPFELLDSNSGKYVGFDIDLIDEVANFCPSPRAVHHDDPGRE